MNTTLFKRLYGMLATVLYHNMNNSGTESISLYEVNDLAYHIRDFINEHFEMKDPFNKNKIDHATLVAIAKDSFIIRGYYMAGENKIKLIKELRALTSVGLKAAKEAIEAAYYNNPSDIALQQLREKLMGPDA